MAGGISTPALAAAVSSAGGLGFIGAGLLTPEALAAQIGRVRELTDAGFGVNLFVPGTPSDPGVTGAYGEILAPLAESAGVALGAPSWDDDEFDGKLAVVLDDAPAVVSFTFGCPQPSVIRRVQDAGAEVWVTVTGPGEARAAVDAGADAVVAQGSEAGGHQGVWDDAASAEPLPLMALLDEVTAAVDRPVVAAGGLMTGAQIAAALAAGADAAQLGTAFMCTPEAGTSRAHRRALIEGTQTTLTRAFTGRTARSIVNGWTEAVGDRAPSAYPEVMHLTAPLRIAGAASGDIDLMHLWAGTGHRLARELPAGEVVREIVAELGAVGGH